MIYNKLFHEDKQIETTETNFEYDNNNRIVKRTVTTTTNINAPIYTLSACANSVNEGHLLEDTIELSERCMRERVIQALAGLASVASIAVSIYTICKKLHS